MLETFSVFQVPDNDNGEEQNMEIGLHLNPLLSAGEFVR